MEHHESGVDWPAVDCAAILIYVGLMGLGCAFSSWPMQKFIDANLWPVARITLWIWVPLRIIDFMRGGPQKRRLARLEYKRWLTDFSGL